jgi:hypothetical protein
MKESAYFVSIVRPPLINWADLKEALRSGRIAGFGADDLPQDDFELWDTPRVVMTPHVSDYSNRYRDNQFLLYRENLRRFVAGERMLGGPTTGTGRPQIRGRIARLEGRGERWPCLVVSGRVPSVDKHQASGASVPPPGGIQASLVFARSDGFRCSAPLSSVVARFRRQTAL